MTALDALPRGRHRQTRTRLHRRVLARFRAARQRRHPVVDIETVRHDAFMVRVEPHVPPPPAVIHARLTALLGALHQGCAGSGRPPAAVLPDEDVPALDHLRGGQYGDDTLAFRRYVDGGQE